MNGEVDMIQLWQTVLAIIASVGGSGVIIFALSKWLSNMIADRFLQTKQAQIDIELEKTKQKLELEIEHYHTQSDEFTFVTKLQFETEFKVYQVLFEKLYDFGVNTANLFPILDQIPQNEDKVREMYKERYKDYCSAYNVFSAVLEQNAPFLPKTIYDRFVELRSKARSIGCMFPEIRIFDDERFETDNREMARENYKSTREFNEMIADIKNEVRDYLGTLKVQD